MQDDGAPLGVIPRPLGDCDGAGQGGHGRALQGDRRVRFPDFILGSAIVWFVAMRGGRSVRSGVEEWLFWLSRVTALHYASENGCTETAMALVKAGADVHCKDNEGYGFSRLDPRVVWFATVRGARSVRSGWSCKSGCNGCAGGRRCTMRRSSCA